MKRKIAYWAVTGLFAVMMAGSAFAYLSGSPMMVDAFHHLGYPDYFRVMLGIAKIIGILALITPFVPKALREWAYAGFVFTLIAAVISHLASQEAGRVAGPILALILVAVSYALQRYNAVSVPGGARIST